MLPGVGPAFAKKLARLGLYTLGDLVFHLPARYEDRTRVRLVREAGVGQPVVVQGEVLAVAVTRRGRPSLFVEMTDSGRRFGLRFFHFSEIQRRHFVPGDQIMAFGELRAGAAGLEMVHPEYRRAAEGSLCEATLTPVYPATAGLNPRALRRVIRAALAGVMPALIDYLPAGSAPPGPPLADALQLLHGPPPGSDLAGARARLAFEELATHHAHLLTLRRGLGRAGAAPCRGSGQLLAAFLQGLPFAPTAAQQKVIAEIRADLARGRPMRRLLQGDVGSGKTLVAAAAALIVIEAGYQAAVMAPTELLARQHLETFSAWFMPLGIEPVGLMRSTARAQARAQIADGRGALVVGTQALFQDSVRFARLGLVVIDEQHRFGVQERQALSAKGQTGRRQAHLLAMSATPIPRTLAQSVYADLDVSILAERPPGRAPVTTTALAEGRRAEVVARVYEACRAGAKAYWVCPLIAEGESDLKAALALHAELAQALRGVTVGLIHGRLKASDKERVMEDFARGATQVQIGRAHV